MICCSYQQKKFRIWTGFTEKCHELTLTYECSMVRKKSLDLQGITKFLTMVKVQLVKNTK